ncbi:hypothetical protein HZF05_03575 [Sphingomonas sp. CGMCC 1.13654]|uniref:Uncharacterized protein n=1 Tax=Sphingomonas chungangi TaxID=2683589 RepID=A0A838L2L2_9SPHN|nr:hypothetical protein [Sphingomonas chungangi]MBA2933170.1 hypothetical protein [Sphingomonas chungangi]MVW57842.1 hypothetical protein [Sphingomonas chungangi]
MPFGDVPVPIALDQQATLIDLDGTTPLIAPLAECVRHFAALKASAKADHRILLTQPVPRKDRPTRTWILNPDDIEPLVAEQAQD